MSSSSTPIMPETLPRRVSSQSSSGDVLPPAVMALGREGRDGSFHQHRRSMLRDPWWTRRSSTFSRLLGCPLFSGETPTPQRDFLRSRAGGISVREVFIFTSLTIILPGALCWLSWEASSHLPYYWQDILASHEYTLFGVFQLLFLISF